MRDEIGVLPCENVDEDGVGRGGVGASGDGIVFGLHIGEGSPSGDLGLGEVLIGGGAGEIESDGGLGSGARVSAGDAGSDGGTASCLSVDAVADLPLMSSIAAENATFAMMELLLIDGQSVDEIGAS